MGLEYIDNYDSFSLDNDPSDQARYFECHQCISHLVNVTKVDNTVRRHLCIILDYENVKISESNRGIINPALRAQLKKCPYHLDVDPEI